MPKLKSKLKKKERRRTLIYVHLHAPTSCIYPTNSERGTELRNWREGGYVMEGGGAGWRGGYEGEEMGMKTGLGKGMKWGKLRKKMKM